MRFLDFVALSGADASTDQNGSNIPASRFTRASAQAVVTGSSGLSGTLKLRASNDKPAATNLENQFVPTNWTDIPDASVSVTGDGTFLLPAVDLCYRNIRVAWVVSGGTGTLSVNLNTHGVA